MYHDLGNQSLLRVMVLNNLYKCIITSFILLNKFDSDLLSHVGLHIFIRLNI